MLFYTTKPEKQFHRAVVRFLREKATLRAMTDWKQNIINDSRGIAEVLRETKSIAVLGIKPETHSGQPAYYVPAHMAAAGYEIVDAPSERIGATAYPVVYSKQT